MSRYRADTLPNYSYQHSHGTIGCHFAGVSVLDPQQAGVLSNAGLQLQQADEAAVTAVTVVLRSLQDLERLIREASSPDVRDG